MVVMAVMVLMVLMVLMVVGGRDCGDGGNHENCSADEEDKDRDKDVQQEDDKKDVQNYSSWFTFCSSCLLRKQGVRGMATCIYCLLLCCCAYDSATCC